MSGSSFSLPATMVDIARAVASKQASAEEVVRETLRVIDSREPATKAFISVQPDAALQRARDVDRAIARGENVGPLAGVPIAVKDNICTTTGMTTCGSRILRDFRSQYAAHVVDRLESAGAIIVGKTNLDEFAMGSSTEHSAFHVTRNPWNSACVAGGSSGGSAAAVAARMTPGALGSDTGGSIRLPASFCGVVGLQPSYGRVSRFGLVAYGSSLDQIGPFATTAEDAAMLLSVISGHDSRDSTSVATAVPDFSASLGRPIRGLRIGVSDEYFGEGLNDEVRRSVESAIDELVQQGAVRVPIHLPHTKYAIACYYLIATAEASSNLARFDGVHYGFRTEKPENVIDMYSGSRGEGFGDEVKLRIMLGTYALSAGYYDAYYLKALKVRTLIKRDFDAAFALADVIASPVAPTTAFRIGEKTQDPLAMYLADIYTISANLAGICAISIPCGFDAGGMPIGFQLMAPEFEEERLLNSAHEYQRVTGYHKMGPQEG